jgi:hypothetical protein
MEELRKNIEQILDQFAKEEYGNRLSQFAMVSLKNLILIEIDKQIVSKKEEPE